MPAQDVFSRSRLNRRRFLRAAGLVGLSSLLPGRMARAEDTVTLPFDNGTRPLVAYPQKRPLILQTSRPPQLETPFAVFNVARPDARDSEIEPRTK